MKAILAALALALSLPVLAPRAVAQSTEPLDRIVAVVDDDVVLQSELDRQARALTTQYANNPQQLPPRDVLERQLLDRLILQKLQVARADSTGVKVSDAEVDQALTSIARNNNMDVSQLRGAIQQQGMNYDQFRRSVQDQLVVQRLRQRVAQSRVQISDAEVDSLLRNGKLGGQLHLGYIMIGVPDGATPEQIDAAHAKADEARQQVEGGMDFGAAAIRYSNAENALQGGDLGWRSRNELPPAFVDAAEHLQDGAISTPLRGPNGFYLVKRFGQREGAGEHVVTEYEARHILIKTSELVSSEQAEAKVAAIRQKIVDGEDFAKAAKESSQDEPTAQLGGDLGWFSGDAYGPKIQQELQSLKPGEISQPFQTNVGWHIVQLVDTRQTDKAGEMQRDEAKNILFQRKAEDEYESFLRQMRSEAYVEIRLPGATTGAGKPGTP
jgi:peptidyl-prolyl cis-trans isomerase SurA